MDDETLKVIGYVISSTYRVKVLKSLAKGDMIPTEIANDSGIRMNHISKVLAELKAKGIVICTNEKQRKNRNYHLTDLGKEMDHKYGGVPSGVRVCIIQVSWGGVLVPFYEWYVAADYGFAGTRYT